MSVKIKSKLKLNTNAYNKLIIREEEKNFSVKVSGPETDDRYKNVSLKLTDLIKKLDDSEKVIAIVDSFLENTFVTSIELSAHCVGNPGLFIKIGGSRELFLQINNKDLLKKLINKIKSKYDRDRYFYLNNSSIQNSYNIILNEKFSGYSRGFIPCEDCEYSDDCQKSNGVCPKYIQFRLMYSNGKLVSFDEIFIKRFIYDKLWEVGFNASIIEIMQDIRVCDGQKVGSAVSGLCIVCGDLKIIFNCSAFSRQYVMDICNNVVNKYNNEVNERENVKRRQLKMEGF